MPPKSRPKQSRPKQSRPKRVAPPVLDAGLPAAFRAHVEQMMGVTSAWETAPGVVVGEADVRGRAWRPGSPGLIVEGDLVVEGNVIVGTGKHDFGVVIVVGAIRCRNLMVAAGFSLVCAGAVTVDEALIASAADSTAYVAGTVTAPFLASGDGAWLTVFDREQLAVGAITRYTVVHAGPPVRPPRAADVGELLVDDVLRLDEQQKVIDLTAVRTRLAAGGSILRSLGRA